jgi:hypothetical protein
VRKALFFAILLDKQLTFHLLLATLAWDNARHRKLRRKAAVFVVAGGIRVNAWVSGGAVPAAQRGKKRTGLVAIWDWYANNQLRR